MKIDKSGFTLMELMLAAAILAAALVGLLGTFTANFRLIESSRNLTVAVNHTQCVMEEIRDRTIPSTSATQQGLEDWAEDLEDWAELDLSDGGGGCNSLNGEAIELTVGAVGTRPLEIGVEVTWTQRGNQRSVQLTTLMTER